MAVKLLSVNEAATALGLKSATIRAWLLRRQLLFVRCGRSVRIPQSVIDEFITKNTVPAKKSSHEG
jgi:excisionase family DNA binding protein